MKSNDEKGFPPTSPSLTFAVQVTEHCVGIAMLLLTENKKRMCRQGQREGISGRDQP